MIDDKAVKRDEVEDVQLNDDDSFMYFLYFNNSWLVFGDDDRQWPFDWAPERSCGWWLETFMFQKIKIKLELMLMRDARHRH